MTLKSRLLLASTILGLSTTLVMAWVIQGAWQSAERAKFEQEFRAGAGELSSQLDRKARELEGRLKSLCQHDPLVDSALVGLQTDSLDQRLLPLKLRLPEHARSLNLDELALVTDRGDVVAGHLGGLDSSSPAGEVQARVEQSVASPGVRAEDPSAFEAGCKAEDGTAWVALVGAMHVDRLLQEAGRRHGLELELIEAGVEAIESDESVFRLSHELPGVEGRLLTASRSRWALDQALRSLNLQIAWAALLTLGVAIFIALLVARGVARPVAAFAARTRDAVRGSVRHIPEEGGVELELAARAFNQTLDDLAALRRRLQATERIAARREVARQVAHEIKNPLSPIRTSVETLRKLRERNHPEFDAYFDQATRTILHEVRRIGALVESFSQYARLPSPRPSWTDLSELSSELASLHRDLGAKIAVQLTPELNVFLDRDQTAQVLTNLLKNALEATRDRPDPLVRLQLERKENLAVLEVHDNGPGVPPDLARHLFEPHVTSKPTGSGLGLPISHRIAVEHGGDLTYSSSPHGGACFRLTLPIDGPPELGPDPPLPEDSPRDVS